MSPTRTFARRALQAAGLFLAFAMRLRAADNEVVVMSPHWDGIKEETARAFAIWHQQTYGQPASIRWHEAGGGGSQMVRLLRAEYKIDTTAGVDVLYGGGVDPFRLLAKDGLLERYDPPAETLAAIPAQLNGMELLDPGHEWFGTALSGFGIITNERVRQVVNLPEVHTWADLADPRLAGWISACDPRASSSALQIYEIVLQACGWEKGWALLTAMSGNVRQFLSSSAASAVEVGMGDSAYGVAIDTYGEAQSGYYGTTNVTFILPEGQTTISPDAVAILKNPPHPEMARHFVEFTLSRAGQLLWMLPKGAAGGAAANTVNRMSVRPALYDELAGRTPVLTDPFKLQSAMLFSDKLSTQRRAILGVLIAASMIDTHDVLSRAWKALHGVAATRVSPDRQQALLAELVAPPCTEDDLLRLAGTDWNNPVRRTELMIQWENQALARDHSVLAQLGAN